MQHVDCTLEPYRVDCTVSVASVIRDHFEDAGADSLPGLCVRMLTSKLRNAEGQADRILDSFRKIQKVVLRGTPPKTGPFLRERFWIAPSLLSQF